MLKALSIRTLENKMRTTFKACTTAVPGSDSQHALAAGYIDEQEGEGFYCCSSNETVMTVIAHLQQRPPSHPHVGRKSIGVGLFAEQIPNKPAAGSTRDK